MTAAGHEFDRSLCIVCGKCAEVCYPGAMVMSGREMTVEAVMAEIRQDKAYYDESGGGVTLSGGEVLCQADFALALTEACRAEGIRVAIETNLASPFEGIRPLLGKVDLVMFDVKTMDGKAHQEWTGMDNGLILENVKKLSALKVPMIARTPLVPGVTDSDGNLAAIAGFLKGVEGIEYYELLNFNPLGEAKYRSLGLANPFETSRPLGQERLAAIAALLETTGMPYRLS
jgi:pyruvate formate lyase activating enzyme